MTYTVIKTGAKDSGVLKISKKRSFNWQIFQELSLLIRVLQQGRDGHWNFDKFLRQQAHLGWNHWVRKQSIWTPKTTHELTTLPASLKCTRYIKKGRWIFYALKQNRNKVDFFRWYSKHGFLFVGHICHLVLCSKTTSSGDTLLYVVHYQPLITFCKVHVFWRVW